MCLEDLGRDYVIMEAFRFAVNPFQPQSKIRSPLQNVTMALQVSWNRPSCRANVKFGVVRRFVVGPKGSVQ